MKLKCTCFCPRPDLCLTRHFYPCDSYSYHISHCCASCGIKTFSGAHRRCLGLCFWNGTYSTSYFLRCWSQKRFSIDIHPVLNVLPWLPSFQLSDLQGRVLASLYFEASSLLASHRSVLNFVLRDILPISSVITDLVRRSSSLPTAYLSTALDSRVAGLFKACDLACPSLVLTFGAALIVEIVSLLFFVTLDMLDWSHDILNSGFGSVRKARNVSDLLFRVLVTILMNFTLNNFQTYFYCCCCP